MLDHGRPIASRIYKDRAKSGILRAANVHVRGIADMDGLGARHTQICQRCGENLPRGLRVAGLRRNRHSLEKWPQLKSFEDAIQPRIEVRDDAELELRILQAAQNRTRLGQWRPACGISEVGEQLLEERIETVE